MIDFLIPGFCKQIKCLCCKNQTGDNCAAFPEPEPDNKVIRLQFPLLFLHFQMLARSSCWQNVLWQDKRSVFIGFTLQSGAYFLSSHYQTITG